MEDAAGVVRRIILLWCEVIIPPCPPSLSSSLVYFWLAAVCVSVCVPMPFPFSTHSLQIRKTGNTGRNIWHLCVFTLVTAPKLGHREDVCLYVCGKMKGVALHKCVLRVFGLVIMLCLHKLKYTQYQKQFPTLPSPPLTATMTINKAEDPVPNYMQRSNTTAKITTAATNSNNLSRCNTKKLNKRMIWRGSTFMQTPAVRDKVYFCRAR